MKTASPKSAPHLVPPIYITSHILGISSIFKLVCSKQAKANANLAPSI